MLALRPPGRGNHSPIVITYNPRRRGDMPAPLQVKVGDPFPLNGVVYRVSEIRT